MTVEIPRQTSPARRDGLTVSAALAPRSSARPPRDTALLQRVVMRTTHPAARSDDGVSLHRLLGLREGWRAHHGEREHVTRVHVERPTGSPADLLVISETSDARGHRVARARRDLAAWIPHSAGRRNKFAPRVGPTSAIASPRPPGSTRRSRAIRFSIRLRRASRGIARAVRRGSESTRSARTRRIGPFDPFDRSIDLATYIGAHP